MNLPTGTLLQGGKYKIVRFISSGGFGCTYEAEHTQLQSRVAIKEFFVRDFCNRNENTGEVSLATQSKAELLTKLRKKFLEEARAVFQMHHPHIVRVMDIFEENGTAYYVMDYIKGVSLHDMLKQRSKLPEVEAVKYIRQVADALKYVHSLNRLHLDIKPGNIMVDSSGNVTLIDFGASKHYSDESGENTTTLMGVNTMGYAPLEQINTSFTHFSPSTDIYALGATLYKLLTGITPPSALSLVSDMATLQPLPSSISKPVRDAVNAAMLLKAKERPQSVDKFLAILDNASSKGVSTDESEVTVLDTKPKQPERPRQATPPTPPTSSYEKSSSSGSKPKKGTSCMFVVAIIFIIFMAILVIAICAGGTGSTNDGSDRGIIDFAETEAIDSAVVDSAYVDYVETKPVEVVDKATGYINGHEWVDLGLSVKWATCNVGASSPSDYGNYYAWGETTTKSLYTWENSVTYNKDMGSIAGNSTYDAARANWGGTWRLPTAEEIAELVDKCKREWTTQGGHRGYKVTGPNGNSIFLPAAGQCGPVLYNAEEYGLYWSATPNEKYASFVYYLCFYDGQFYRSMSYRNEGRPVRPVSE